MKKYFFAITSSLILGIVMAIFLINSYDKNKTMTLSINTKKIFYIERGAYSSKKNMEENMIDFENYIYSVEDGKYHSYIGVAKSKNNAIKIQKTYKNYKTNIKEKVTSNKKFITILGQYDKILSKTNNENMVKTVCNQILSKYEELISDEY